MKTDETSSILATTRYCAVYGHPVRHSASPAMHNAALASLGLNWRYLAFDVHPDRLADAIRGAAAMKFIGLNLTVPHKLLALDQVEVVEETARRWGAVNTIRFEARDSQGQWRPLAEFLDTEPAPEEVRAHGFNTDADALVQALQEDLGLPALMGKRVLLLGAGGVGRVAALRLATEGVAQLWLINRTAEKAEAIAADIRASFPQTQVQVGYPPGPVDVLINATSLGLHASDALPLDTARYPVRRARAVYDMIYRPSETPLLQAARSVGCATANGLGMLLYQGAKALEIWTGLRAPLPLMRQALVRNVYGHPQP